jgi:hypothetical protein
VPGQPERDRRLPHLPPPLLDTRFFSATGFTYGPDPRSTDFWVVDVHPNATNPDTMAAARMRLKEDLSEKVSDSSLRLYSYAIPDNDSVLGTNVISGLAQVHARDMAPSECSSCIASLQFIAVDTARYTFASPTS